MKANLEQLYEIGDNWRTRTINLANYYKDESNPIEKRIKAYRLSWMMTERVLALSREVLKRTQPSPKLSKGGQNL